MRKSILLLNPPGTKRFVRDCYCSDITKLNYYWHPLDLLIQSGFLKLKFNLKVIDAIASSLNKQSVLEEIKKMEVNYILSLVGEICSSKDFQFLNEVKKIKDSVVIIGSGDILKFKAKEILGKYNIFDAILLDFTSPNLVNFLDKSNFEGEINDIIYKKNGIIISSKEDRKKWFEYPIPALEFFLKDIYSLPLENGERFHSILSSYGCPYKCNFCNTSKIGYKMRKVKNFINELKYVNSLGIRNFYLRDATFGINKEHVFEICEEIIKKEIKIKWNCFSRVDLLDKPLLKIMKKAGCFLVQFGVETYDDITLKESQKGITKKQIKDAFKYCEEMGIKTSAHFILGLNQFDLKNPNKFLSFAKELNTDYVSFNILRSRVGSDIQRKNVNKNLNYLKMRRHLNIRFYLRPLFILKRLKQIRSINKLKKIFLAGINIFRL